MLFLRAFRIVVERIFILFFIKTENETEIDIETKSLAAKIVQTVYDCPNFSNSLPSSPFTISGGQSVANPLASIDAYKTQTNEFGETVYECPVCGKCFQKRRYVNEHMRIHSLECSLCHKKWVQSQFWLTINLKIIYIVSLPDSLKISTFVSTVESNWRINVNCACVNFVRKWSWMTTRNRLVNHQKLIIQWPN